MSNATTRVDKFLARLKNNPFAASLIVMGTILIALATFTDSMRKLLDVFQSRNSLMACRTDQWTTQAIQNPYSEDDRFCYTFKLTAIGNQLTGSLRQTSLKGRYDINNPIDDGSTDGEQVYFVVDEVWVEGGKREIRVRRSFKGNIVGNNIHFVETNNQGQMPREFIASCTDGAVPTPN
ncbi:MAG: hypothetical protein ACXV7J_03045 [Methylomonas sp.]